MSFYFVTGKLGNGKSLVSVSRIKLKLEQGCPVATNIDLDLTAMFHDTAKNINVVRVPDKPTLSDLKIIGVGNSSYDESKNGLLVLDECGSWFNSRNWQDKSRSDVNDWFRHARKLGWDVILIVQDISLIDNQAREALSEHVAFCRRMDNIRVPFIGGLYKALTGYNLTLPKVHVARVVYGTLPTDMLSDRWVYKGTDLFHAYDTKQIFQSDYSVPPYCLLTPWHLTRHYKAKRNKEFFMRLTKIYLKKLKSPLAIVAGLFLGVLMSYLMTVYANNIFFKEYLLLQDAVKKVEQLASNNVVEDVSFVDKDLIQFEDWKIVGYSSYSDGVYFDFETGKESSGEDSISKTISSRDLVSSFEVLPLGPCHARIQSGEAFRDVFCF